MYTFEEVAQMMDDIVDGLPEEITRGLAGGVYLVPEVKVHPKLPFPQYAVLGEYVTSSTGARIYLYYNSIMAKYVDASPAEMREVLRQVIHHEFRHHMEHQAGVRDLEIEDERYVRKALSRLGRPAP